MAQPPLLTKVVLEVRYADGELYWDLSGRVRRSLRLSNSAWDFSATPDRNFWQCRLPLEDPPGALQCSFGALKSDFTFEPQPWTKTARFPLGTIQAHILQSSQVILDALSIERCTRVGLRIWQLLPVGSPDDARNLAKSISYRATPPKELGEQTGGAVIGRYQLESAEARVSLGDATLESNINGESRHGLLLDIDYRKLLKEETLDLAGHLTGGVDYVAEATAALSREMFGSDDG